jgi:hypothetical protein
MNTIFKLTKTELKGNMMKQEEIRSTKNDKEGDDRNINNG